MDSFCCLCENQHNLHIFSPSRSHSCLCSCFCLPAGGESISFLTRVQGKRRVLVLRITLQIIRNDPEKIILSLQLFFAFTVNVIHSESSFLLYSFHTHTTNITTTVNKTLSAKEYSFSFSSNVNRHFGKGTVVLRALVLLFEVFLLSQGLYFDRQDCLDIPKPSVKYLRI